MRDQLRELTGGEGVNVSVDEAMGVEGVAAFAPVFRTRIEVARDRASDA